MTLPRSKTVDLELTRFYHCLSRCVRQLPLLKNALDCRKFWIQERLRFLADIFAISVGGYAIMDNHLHVIACLDGPEWVDKWSDVEVAKRWGRLFPPRDAKRRVKEIDDAWIREKVRDKKWIKMIRKRLCDLGWFMKCLKEPLSRMANKEDGKKGAFFEARYKSIAILDEEALLATCVYADLNPIAAGSTLKIEESPFTSIRERIKFCTSPDRMQSLVAARTLAADGHAVPREISAKLESGLWLNPIDSTNGRNDGHRGLAEGLTLAHYLAILDSSSRIAREGKCHVPPDAESVFDRLGISAKIWSSTLQRLFSTDRLRGVYFAFSKERLQEVADRNDQQRVVNLC